MLYRYGILLLLCFSLFACMGCQFTQSSFARTTSNAGASFAAASTTLSSFHQGRITRSYTSSSFEGFQEELQGLDQQLPSLSGAPDKQELQQLLRAYKQAMTAIEHPCLDNTCHWQAQISTLKHASTLFLRASGSD